MQGLLDERKKATDEDGHDIFVDAALTAAAQCVEHHEISAYGASRAIAGSLGNVKVARILQLMLDEESAADHKSTQLSTNDLLNVALRVGNEDHISPASWSRRESRDASPSSR